MVLLTPDITSFYQKPEILATDTPKFKMPGADENNQFEFNGALYSWDNAWKNFACSEYGKHLLGEYGRKIEDKHLLERVNSFEKEFIELKNKISTLQIQVQNLEGVVFAPEKIYIPLKNAESLEYFDFPMAPEKIKSKNFSLKIGSKLHEDFFKYSEKYGINKADIVESYIYHLVNKLKNKSLENDETKR
jgi:hypothetical protein